MSYNSKEMLVNNYKLLTSNTLKTEVKPLLNINVCVKVK